LILTTGTSNTGFIQRWKRKCNEIWIVWKTKNNRKKNVVHLSTNDDNIYLYNKLDETCFIKCSLQYLEMYKNEKFLLNASFTMILSIRIVNICGWSFSRSQNINGLTTVLFLNGCVWVQVLDCALAYMHNYTVKETDNNKHSLWVDGREIRLLGWSTLP